MIQSDKGAGLPDKKDKTLSTATNPKNGLSQILRLVLQELNLFYSRDVNGVRLLYDLLNSPWLQALLKVYDCLQEFKEQKLVPATPHAQALSCEALLSAHDTVAQKDFEPLLPPLPDNIPESEEAMRIVCLVKNQQPLGATIKRHEMTGDILVARVIHGGLVERSGLLYAGDKLVEVNGVSVEGLDPEQVIHILAMSRGTIMFKVVPVSEPPVNCQKMMYVRAMTEYWPQEDPAIPCMDAGLPFQKGDILQIVDQNDALWWQARKISDLGTCAGLIPSNQLLKRKQREFWWSQPYQPHTHVKSSICECADTSDQPISMEEEDDMKIDEKCVEAAPAAPLLVITAQLLNPIYLIQGLLFVIDNTWYHQVSVPQNHIDLCSNNTDPTDDVPLSLITCKRAFVLDPPVFKGPAGDGIQLEKYAYLPEDEIDIGRNSLAMGRSSLSTDVALVVNPFGSQSLREPAGEAGSNPPCPGSDVLRVSPSPAGFRRSMRLCRRKSHLGQLRARGRCASGRCGPGGAAYEEVVRYQRRPSDKHRLVVLVGPSGVGVNELRRQLIELNPNHFQSAVPHTTRSQKSYEMNGREYHYVSKEAFESLVYSHRMLEYGEYKGHLYGTSVDAVQAVLDEGKICVLDLEPQNQGLRVLTWVKAGGQREGVSSVQCEIMGIQVARTHELKPYVIFIKPSNMSCMKQSRKNAKIITDYFVDMKFKDEDLQEMEDLAQKMETQFGQFFDHVIVNDRLQDACAQLLSAVQKAQEEPQWVPATKTQPNKTKKIVIFNDAY
ncbi:hypothetical protein HPG69_004661, partial [Diceros bicornis minor]